MGRLALVDDDVSGTLARRERFEGIGHVIEGKLFAHQRIKLEFTSFQVVEQAWDILARVGTAVHTSREAAFEKESTRSNGDLLSPGRHADHEGESARTQDLPCGFDRC